MAMWHIETTAQLRRVYEVDAETAEEAEALLDECNPVELLVHEEDISEEIDDVRRVVAAASAQGAPAQAPEPTK